MPAQTVMQVRRDTAANWSSANPVLANGEMGYDTTNKLFKVGDGSTAWNSLKVMAQHDTGSAARPLLTGGAYLSGSGLVLSGLASNYASAPDSAALSITGDIDIKVKVAMTDWTPSAIQMLVCKQNGATAATGGYRLSIETDGTIGLRWTTSVGGSINIFSSAATGVADGATKWVRATIDVNDGAGNYQLKFYTSDNGTTWTQLGTTRTAGATDITDGNSALEIGRDTATTGRDVNGTVYRTIIQSAYDTADNTTNVVFDSNFETATADALAFNATSDAGIKTDGLVLKGRTGEYASAPDSAALSITGDIDIKVKVAMTDWTPAALQTLVAKYNGSTQRSYFLYVNTDGTLTLATSPDGTSGAQVTGTSTVATGVTDGATKWVRATLDVNDGAGNRVYKFYTSDNGTSWTQLGTTITTAGTTSIYDGPNVLEVGSRDVGQSNLLNGTIYRTIIQSAYDTADNTSNLAFDADFDAQTPEITSFTESSSNAAPVSIIGTNPVVTINTTRYTYGVPGVNFTGVTTGSPGANNLFYSPFIVTKAITVDMYAMEFTSSSGNIRVGVYNADENFQPTGSSINDSGQLAVSGAGAVTRQVTPFTLQPGNYLIAYVASQANTLRRYFGQPTFAGALTSTPFATRFAVAYTFGALPSSPPAWDIRSSESTATTHQVLLRYKAAS